MHFTLCCTCSAARQTAYRNRLCVMHEPDSGDKKWGQARGGDGKGKVSNILQ